MFMDKIALFIENDLCLMSMPICSNVCLCRYMLMFMAQLVARWMSTLNGEGSRTLWEKLCLKNVI